MNFEVGKKDDVKEFFARNAAAYAASYRNPTPDLGRLLELLEPKPEWEGLDIAAGTGRVTVALAPRVRRMVAVDLTPEMEAEFQKTFREAGLTGIPFEVGDAEALPFDDASFDVATCARAAHHFPSVDQAVREMARVLRPGGRLGVSDMTTPEDPAGAAFMNAMEIARDGSHVRAVDRWEWHRLLAASGLSVAAWDVLEEIVPFGQWLSPVSVDSDEAKRVSDVLTSTPSDTARHVLRETDEGRMVIKRRLILIGEKP